MANPFGSAGGYRDSESGLYYLVARYYDPSTQQFLSVDPLLAVTGQAYNYVGGSPVNGCDPSGLETDGVCIQVGGAGLPLFGGSVGINGSLCFVAAFGPHDPLDLAVQFSPGGTVGTPNRAVWGSVLGLRSVDANRAHDLDGLFVGAGGSLLVSRLSIGPRPLPNLGQLDAQLSPDGKVHELTCGAGLGIPVGSSPPIEIHTGASNTITLFSTRDLGDFFATYFDRELENILRQLPVPPSAPWRTLPGW